MAIAGSWQLLRALSAQVAEAVADPSAALFQPLASTPITGDAPRFLEFMFDLGAVGGGANPDSVTFTFWRLNPAVPSPGSGAATIDRLGSYTIPAADIAIPQPVTLEYWGGAGVWVTVSFSGGTTPTVTASVYMRGAN